MSHRGELITFTGEHPVTLKMILDSMTQDEALKAELRRKVASGSYKMSEMTRQVVLFLVFNGYKDNAERLIASAAILDAAMRIPDFDDITEDLEEITVMQATFDMRNGKNLNKASMLVRWQVDGRVTTKFSVKPADPGELGDLSRYLEIRSDQLMIAKEFVPETVADNYEARINQKIGEPVYLREIIDDPLLKADQISDQPLVWFGNHEDPRFYAVTFHHRQTAMETVRKQIRLITEFSINGNPL